MSHTGALKVESLIGPDFDGEPANNRFLLIYHGHMRMLQPPADFKLADFFARLKAEKEALGPQLKAAEQGRDRLLAQIGNIVYHVTHEKDTGQSSMCSISPTRHGHLRR